MTDPKDHFDTDIALRGESGFSRRSFLQKLAIGGAAAVTGVTSAAAQVPPAPTNFRILPTSSPTPTTNGKRVLQSSDLQFAGWFRLPLINGADWIFSSGGFTSRVVGSQRRFLMMGPGGLCELADPGSYTQTIAGSPVASLVRQ
jgi:hypothetical protein